MNGKPCHCMIKVRGFSNAMVVSVAYAGGDRDIWRLLKSSAGTELAQLGHGRYQYVLSLVQPGLKKLPFRQGLGACNLANRYPSKGIDISARLY